MPHLVPWSSCPRAERRKHRHSNCNYCQRSDQLRQSFHRRFPFLFSLLLRDFGFGAGKMTPPPMHQGRCVRKPSNDTRRRRDCTKAVSFFKRRSRFSFSHFTLTQTQMRLRATAIRTSPRGQSVIPPSSGHPATFPTKHKQFSIFAAAMQEDFQVLRHFCFRRVEDNAP